MPSHPETVPLRGGLRPALTGSHFAPARAPERLSLTFGDKAIDHLTGAQTLMPDPTQTAIFTVITAVITATIAPRSGR